MNLFEKGVAQYLGTQRLKQIQQVRVGIAGAGGLGSNCAMNLVRTGFKHLTIADFDSIEYTNLNRQFYFYQQVSQPKVEALRDNLLAINPDLDVKIIKLRLTIENMRQVFQHCQVIVEAFDQAAYKKMLVETFLPTASLLVSASGLAGWESSDSMSIHKIRPNFYLIGDLSTAVSPDTPPLAPRVAIAAAKQAEVVLRYALEEGRDCHE